MPSVRGNTKHRDTATVKFEVSFFELNIVLYLSQIKSVKNYLSLDYHNSG